MFLRTLEFLGHLVNINIFVVLYDELVELCNYLDNLLVIIVSFSCIFDCCGNDLVWINDAHNFCHESELS